MTVSSPDRFAGIPVLPRYRFTTAPVTVDDRCTACGACLATCPEHALVPSSRRPRVLEALCTGCLECVEVCPRDAISEISGHTRRSW